MKFRIFTFLVLWIALIAAAQDATATAPAGSATPTTAPAPVYYIVVTDTAALQSLPPGSVVYANQSATQIQPTTQTAPKNVYNFKQVSQENKPTQKQSSKKRSSFFFDATLGFQYSYYETEVSRDYWESDNSYTSRSILESNGPLISFKFGSCIREFIAPHGTVELSFGTGDFEYKKKENGKTTVKFSQYNVDFVKFFLGVGFTIFPFTDSTSAMYGSFISSSIGYGLGEVDSHYYYYDFDDDFVSIGFRVELGKVWKMSDRWNFGVSTAFSLDAPITSDDDDDYNSDDDERNIYSVWVGFKITRK